MACKIYYETFFPAEVVVEWYGGTKRAPFIEWSYFVDKPDGSYDHSCRFSADNAQELRAILVGACVDNPNCFISYHVGPSYEHPYSAIVRGKSAGLPDYRSAAGNPMHKPFVIDIDVTDFIEQRDKCGCKQDKSKLCPRCWQFLGIVTKAVATHLISNYQDDTNLVCFYTGGRGIHLYVRGQVWENLSERRRALLCEDIGQIQLGEDPVARRQIETELELPLPGNLSIDIGASTNLTHLLRGIFSARSSGHVGIPVKISEMHGTPPRESGLCPNINDLASPQVNPVAVANFQELVCNIIQ